MCVCICSRNVRPVKGLTIREICQQVLARVQRTISAVEQMYRASGCLSYGVLLDILPRNNGNGNNPNSGIMR